MSTQQIIDLFDRWERVWHEVKLHLVPDCVGPLYVRHEEAGDRTVTPETYAAEIARAHQERPGIGSPFMTTHSAATGHGSALGSSGPIQQPVRRAAAPACSSIGSKAASWSRHGCRCSHSARHGAISRRSVGQVRQP